MFAYAAYAEEEPLRDRGRGGGPGLGAPAGQRQPAPLTPDSAGTASILVQCACDELPLSLDRDHSNNVAQILVNPTVPANGLAATGNRVGLIVGLGGLMLLLGAVTVVLARRRRLPFTR